MKKFLLSAAVVAMTAMSAQALDLPLDNLGSGWGDATYDPATHTIAYVADWTGKGWWLEDVDYSKYTHVEVEVAPLTIQVQMAVQYVGASDSDNSSSGMCNLGDTKIVAKLNDSFKAHTSQIYIQCASLTDNPTVTILSAKVVDNSGAAPDLVLWSGEQQIDWWSNAVTLVPAKFENLKTDDSLEIDYKLSGESAGALKLLEVMAGWSENKILPGFAALSDFNSQYETVNVTEPEGTFSLPISAEDAEILKNPANIQFMITGDGVIVTKVWINQIIGGFSDIVAPVKGDGIMYNLMGLPVDSNYKGIVIKDGKKHYNR